MHSSYAPFAEREYRPMGLKPGLIFSDKPGGSGSSLSLARQIARSHGSNMALLPETTPGAAFVMNSLGLRAAMS